MLKIKRTNSDNTDFIKLVSLLDADLAKRNGDEHAFYNQFNSIDTLKSCIVLYFDEKPIACGAFKAFDENAVEIKRMYTLPEARGKGVASKVLSALENWAKELDFQKCVLETGVYQPEAILLYEKTGYDHIPNYGQYHGVESSRCFEKILPS